MTEAIIDSLKSVHEVIPTASSPNLSFWITVVIAALALLANGSIAYFSFRVFDLNVAANVYVIPDVYNFFKHGVYTSTALSLINDGAGIAENVRVWVDRELVYQTPALGHGWDARQLVLIDGPITTGDEGITPRTIHVYITWKHGSRFASSVYNKTVQLKDNRGRYLPTSAENPVDLQLRDLLIKLTDRLTSE
jgi:hypothetical protein